VLVIEQPKDLIALEQTGMYRGVYHVLLGRLSPLEGIGPEELTVADLLQRVDHPDSNAGGVKVEEVIMGMNPTLEGDGTALYLTEQLRTRGVRVSRLARGLPSGSQLEYANKAVLADAIVGRQRVS
jgi:recombination protein RecR